MISLAEAFTQRSADVRARFSGKMSDQTVRVLLSVRPEYLEIAFDRIAEEYGSVRTYLSNALQVDSTMEKRLADRLIEQR